MTRRTGPTMGTGMLRSLPLLFACAFSNAATPGIVRIDHDGVVRLYSLAEIKADDPVRFQYLAADRSVRCCVQRSGGDFRQLAPDPVAQNAESGEPAKQYRLDRPIKRNVRLPFVGSAIIGDSGIRQLPDSSLQVGRRSLGEVVKSCTSPEGVHVLHETLGRRRSDIYFGLGYEVEAPSCEAK